MLENLKARVVGAFSAKRGPTIDARNDKSEERIGHIMEDEFKESIVDYVNQEFERRKQERMPFELQWQLNMNFLLGNQYCDINTVTGEIQEIDREFWWQERQVYNHIAPTIETRLSKLSRVRPSMFVRPATSDVADISTAKVCTNIVKAAYNKLNMNQEIQSATAWSEITGTVVYKDAWDPNAGQIIGIVNREPIYEGDITNYVVPPYEFFPDSCYADDLDSCRSVIHAKAYHVDDIEEIWNVRVDGREVDVFTLTNTNIGTGGLGYTANVPKITSTVRENHEIVIEYYERPSRRYPEGRLIIVAGDELLHYGSLPYKIGEDSKRDFPFSRQVCIERPGCFWGISIIERLIPIQRAFNAVKNRKHEFLNRAAIGVTLVQEGSTDIDDLQEDGFSPGKIIPYKQGYDPPKFMDNQPIPPQFAQEEEDLVQEFILISGVSEISRNSAAPTGAGSGVALQLLTEQDDTRLSLTAENIRFAILKKAKHWLRLYKQFAVGPRMDRIVGEKNDVLVAHWKASDITSDDVVPETENELTQTPAQRKQMVYDLLQAGLFNDPDTGTLTRRMRSKVLEALQMGNWEGVDDIDEMQATRAQRENMLIQDGVSPIIREYDDDEIHIQEHNRFRLSGDYDELLRMNPQFVAIFDEHVKKHERTIELKNQLAMQKQAIMQAQMMPQGGINENTKAN
jgi:hypothetical protein